MGIAMGFAGLASLLGLGLGLMALFNPDWVGRFVRLQPAPDRAEGRAELRANYGGWFVGLHAGALIWLGVSALDRDLRLEAAAAVGAVGTGWVVLGVVRWIFAARDGAVTRYNLGGAVFELTVGAALLAPLGVAVFA